MPYPRKYEPIPCRHCKGLNVVHLRIRKGSHRWKCRDCNKVFSTFNGKYIIRGKGKSPIKLKPKPKIHYVNYPSASRVFELAEKRANLEKQIERRKMIMNVDSIADIPCTLCPKLKQTCNPESCVAMDSWLGIPNPQHRLSPNPQNSLSSIEKKKEVFGLVKKLGNGNKRSM